MKKHITSFCLLILWTMVVMTSCQQNEKSTSFNSTDSNGFERMKDSIEMIYHHQTDFLVNTYENDQRVKLLKEDIERRKNVPVDDIFRYAVECLNNGQTELAINVLNNIGEFSPEFKDVNQQTLTYHKFLGICYLRLAEQNNCIHNHNDESCIVPIKGGGVHLDKTGSELAIDKYTEILKVEPQDMESRWLLNLAYMTLDRYPEDVPENYLIPMPEQADVKALENIATRAGLDYNHMSGGVITDDFNNDQLLDIIITSWSFTGDVKYYENHGAKGFIDKTEQSGLHKAVGGLNIKQADFNNDGNIDFIILRGAWKPNDEWGIPSNSLIRNNGDGTFSDVTFEANMYSRRSTQAAEWFDFNNDGWLDLFVVNETARSSKKDAPCELYLNNGDGTFNNVAGLYGVDLVGYFKGVSSGDINNDGWPDLFISNLQGSNVLLLNQYEKTPNRPFKDITQEAGVVLPFSAFPAWFFDFNNDGWDDIYVATYGPKAYSGQAEQFAQDMLGGKVESESNRLYKNNGDLTFEDVTGEYFKMNALTTMGCNYGDINNDGYLDFYLGTGAPDYRAVVPNRFFTSINGERYEDQTFALGVGHIQKGHGVAFADLDNDGDQDVYAVMGGAYKGDKFANALFENPGHSNHWIKLKLEGVESNRSAIGAKIRVTGIDKSNDTISIYKTVNSGASFGGNSLMAHIGLGNMEDIEKVQIMWPDGNGTYKSYNSLAIDRTYYIKEGEKPKVLELQSFEFNKSMKKEHHHHMHSESK